MAIFTKDAPQDAEMKKEVDEINKKHEVPPEEPKKKEEPVAPKLEPVKPEAKDPEQKPPATERPVENVPLWKLRDEESKVKKLSDEIELTKKETADLKEKLAAVAEASTKKETEDAANDIKKFAAKLSEEKGIEADLVEAIVNAAVTQAKKSVSVPLELLNNIKQMEEQKKLDNEKKFWDDAFEKNFGALVETDAEATAHKDALKSLYFSEKYAGKGKTPYALADIWKLEKENHVTVSKKTGEGTRGGVKPVVVDVSDPKKFLEDMKGKWGTLSREEREKVYEQMDSLHGSIESLKRE